MAVEYDSSGIIEKTLKDSAIVSFDINGVQKKFSFSKAIFYAWGCKCEGQLSNILEDGQAVSVSCKFSPSGTRDSLILVWIGPKPTVTSYGNKCLKPIYGARGQIVSYFDSEHFLVMCNNSELKVLVSKGVTFRDGSLLSKDELSVNETINFDAAALQEKHPSGALYQATCAWSSGKEPSPLDRFGLRMNESFQAGDSEVIDVEGTVVVIPNEVLCFADVLIEESVIKVVLFRNCFTTTSDCIQDIVEVGDTVHLKVRWGCLFPRGKQYFALQAQKASEEINFVSNSVIASSEVVTGYVNQTSNEVKTDNSETKAVFITKPKLDFYEMASVKPIPIKTISKAKQFDESNNSKHVIRVEPPVNHEPITKNKQESLTGVHTLDFSNFQKNASAEKEKSDSNATQTYTIPRKRLPSEKPEKMIVEDEFQVLFQDPPLTGIITKSSFDSASIDYLEKFKIFVSLKDIYIDGTLCNVSEFLKLVEPGSTVVNFEAVATNSDKNPKFTHEATCVWLGEKPSVSVIAESLPRPNFALAYEEGQVFVGFVTKLCFPQIALVVVKAMPFNVTVSLHTGAFKSEPKYGKGNLISDYVRLNDILAFEIKPHLMIKTLLRASNAEYIVLKKNDYRIAVTGEGCRLAKKSKSTEPEEKDENKEKNHEPSTSVSDDKYRFSLVEKASFNRNLSYLINCSGVLKIDEKSREVTVKHTFGTSIVGKEILFGQDNKLINSESLPSYNGRIVRFDAWTENSCKKNENYLIQRIWLFEKRPPVSCILGSKLEVRGLATFLPKIYPGKITSIPFHDSAIATVKGVPVNVPFKSIVTDVKLNSSCFPISSYVSIGDNVAVRIERQNFPAESNAKFFEASYCWRLGTDQNFIETVNIPDLSILSWFNAWGFGEYYKTETLKYKDGKFFVSFHSSRRPNLRLKLDVFEKGKVYVDGNLADSEKLVEFVGKNITFHVGHVNPKALVDETGMYVAVAWIGEEPSAKEILKDQLKVPKGLIQPNWLYQGNVTYFPLPTHAVCRVHHTPVLVPLCKIEEEGEMIGVKQNDLKKGDNVWICIQEQTDGDDAVLFCNRDDVSVDTVLHSNVLKNMCGTVIELPKPTGKIKPVNADFEVSFELAHVVLAKKQLTKKKVKSMINNLSQTVKFGQEVCFSAFKVAGKTAPYRAFEVYLSCD